jgi:hypothetical protein
MTLKKESTALATKDTVTKPAKTSVSNLVLGNADDALRLATELQKFVKANKLTSNIQGKEFPNVEAWQFAGSLLGLSPMLETIEDKSDAQQIKWNATVKIISVHSGAEVGRGFATCSNKESTKKFFQDYAICSMAQTRAVGKAYRLALGWLMKAAGYEATPAEEMSDMGTGAEVVQEMAPAMTATATPPVEAELPPVVEGAPLTPRTNKLIKLALDAYDADVKGGAGYEQRLLDSLRSMSEEKGTKVLRWLEVQPKKKQPAPSKKAAPTTSLAPANVALVQEFRDHPTADDHSPVHYLTAEQRKELERLVELPAITRPEKTLILLNINRLDESRAQDAITKLTQAIEEREGGAGTVAQSAIAA